METETGEVPGPMGLQEGRVVHDGGQQGGEGPQQEGGEELGDDWILETGGEAQTPLNTTDTWDHSPQCECTTGGRKRGTKVDCSR